MATSPYARIDSERRKGYRVMSADVVKNIKLKGAGAALIVSSTESLLDAIDMLEKDNKLPLSVESRRSDMINASAYWSSNVTPHTVDEYIKYAQMGGFRCMLIHYTSLVFIFKRKGGYYVVYWYTTSSGQLKLALKVNDVDMMLQNELGGKQIPFSIGKSGITIPVERRCYFKSNLSKEKLIEAFENAELI